MGSWMRTAFVTVDQADATVIQREWNERRDFKINSSAVTNMLNEQPPFDVSKMARYGVHAWLDQLYNAPDPVKEFIRVNSGTHLVAVGTDKADMPENVRALQALMGAPSRLITPSSLYNVKRSSYGSRAIYSSIEPVKDSKLLSAGVDETKKRELEGELGRLVTQRDGLTRRRNELKEAERQLLALINQLEKQKVELHSQLTNRDSLERRIANKRNQVSDLEREEDTQQEQVNMERHLKKLNGKRLDNAKQLCELLGSLTDDTLALNLEMIKREQAKVKLQQLKTQDQEFLGQLKQLDAVCQQARAHYQTARDKAKQLKLDAEQIADKDTHRELFDRLPDTLDELDTLMHAAKAKADLNYINNPKVIEDYEARKKQIDELQQKLAAEADQLEAQAAAIEAAKADWLPRLETLVERINASFSRHFARIGCQGEVALAKDDSDFGNWAIDLRVKFRSADSLHNLTAKLQSGGERSVSTMLYLISLQDLTPCPFRLVDEINQAMDQKNERMIFQVVADTACKPGLPQYFLITPKLLPDLPFTEQMTILNINNGPGQLKHTEWGMSKWLDILANRRREK
eukprot:TRINITY_DN963_c0_g3_i3.p1 TRINITY_DN963_c0_g3~~TRINITY_DN963_c0_g3_i3.p1  ORF type:complete len:575 (+),score=267.63 TRINITY_DN963_c0_g3_i3:1789-3513(+)